MMLPNKTMSNVADLLPFLAITRQTKPNPFLEKWYIKPTMSVNTYLKLINSYLRLINNYSNPSDYKNKEKSMTCFHICSLKQVVVVVAVVIIIIIIIDT